MNADAMFSSPSRLAAECEAPQPARRRQRQQQVEASLRRESIDE
jgi:hypothetical protein